MRILPPSLALLALAAAMRAHTPPSDAPSPKLVIMPLPEAAPAPPGNPATTGKIALGRLLFFDPVLSATGDVACATCHHPSLGWADGRATPLGVNAAGIGPARRRARADQFPIVKRNAPTVLNAGFNGITIEGRCDPQTAPMFWDSRELSLEAQALAPIRAAEEMRGDVCAESAAIGGAVKRVRDIALYRDLFAKAFGTGDVMTAVNLGKAIAAFERSLVTADAPYDRFARGDAAALTDLQKRGLKAFESAGCPACHNGPMLSDYKLHFIGTPGQKENRDFRTPSLRNLKHTAPYMHNGSVATIADVLIFYDRLMDASSETLDGGDAPAQPLDPLLKTLNVNPDDFAAIEAFLDGLNDDSYDRSMPDAVPSGLPVPK
ncbi:MAG: cytochrome-c peroxidase [Verrucomicrobiaceae bacterium]|nr:cytochrome-c peroxidase [Verrucomicrobiaceae bacterium]